MKFNILALSLAAGSFVHLAVAQEGGPSAEPEPLFISATETASEEVESSATPTPEPPSAPVFEKLYTIKTAPGKKRLVTEDEMWYLKERGLQYMDITDFPELDEMESRLSPREPQVFPQEMRHSRVVQKMASVLSKGVMETNLNALSQFHNRFYTSEHGQRSSEWLFAQVARIVRSSDSDNVTVQAFSHSWPQRSIIVTIPGVTASTIVIGAHQDSINMTDKTFGRAPGADDNGSGTVAILEALRAILTNEVITTGDARNTIEFHWYAGEEAGLLGSQDIFRKYAQDKREVKAMLNFDMTGFIKGRADKGKPPTIAVGVDGFSTDTALTDYVKLAVREYTKSEVTEVKCNYACSDHAAAAAAGYPAAFAFESAWDDKNPVIHTEHDNMSSVDMDNVLEHAKLALGFAYELGMHNFGSRLPTPTQESAIVEAESPSAI